MRPKLVPLSETMHLILLALREPLHGYRIMQLVSEMSKGDVNIAAGTLYGALENLKNMVILNFYLNLVTKKYIKQQNLEKKF